MLCLVNWDVVFNHSTKRKVTSHFYLPNSKYYSRIAIKELITADAGLTSPIGKTLSYLPGMSVIAMRNHNPHATHLHV